MRQPDTDRLPVPDVLSSAHPGAPVHEPDRRRRRRQQLSRSDKVLVALIFVGVASAAAGLGKSAPSTVQWVDAAERFAWVVVTALAGLRARRWSLVTGAALVTIFGTGLSVLVGSGTLICVVILTLVDKRSRVVGSAIGALIAFLALFLSVPGPLGTETLVALVATMPIWVSGYKIHVSSKSGRRRKMRRVFLGVISAAALCLVAAGVAAATSYRNIESAMSSVQSGLKAAESGKRELAVQKFDAAHGSFAKADRTINSLWASSGLVIPGLGANLSAVQDAVAAGERLTATADSIAGDIDFSDIQRPDGGVDLERLSELGDPLVDTTDTLAEVQQTLSKLTSPWLLPPVASKVDDFSSRVRSTHEQSKTALLAVEKAPAILGADGPRRYLFLFGNPAEARDLGGHLGNWAEVTVDNGKINLVQVGGPLDLAVDSQKLPAGFGQDFPPSLVDMDPARFPHNWSSSRDLPTVAKLASELFPISTGRKIDGVVYADVRSFAAFLELTGPMVVPNLEPRLELNPKNAVEFLTRGQFERFASESVAGDALEEMIHRMFDSITSKRLPSPERLAQMFAPLVSQGQFRMATLHSDDTALLDRLGLRGQIKGAVGEDMLAVINRNAGPSKIDSFLARKVSADILWNPQTGGVESEVKVELHNAAPPAGLNRTIYGNDAFVPAGTNLTDVAVLSPFRLQSVEVEGAKSTSHTQREGKYWRYTVRVAVPPEGNRVILFKMDGMVDRGPRFVLSFNGQSLLNPGQAVIRVRSTTGGVTMAGEPSAQANQGTVEVSESLDKVLVWRSEGS